LPIVTVQELIDAGVHFGHRTSRWNPKMKPYLQGKRNSIHIIDLKSTVRGLVLGSHFLRNASREGYQILFVGTKRGAKTVIREEAQRCNMPFVTERWLGGTLTNFDTIRVRLQRLEELENIEKSGEINAMSKKELSAYNREKRKLLKNLEGIRTMTNLPGALVVVDPRREHIAVREANRVGIPIVALVDTDSDPDPIDIPIPANDDAMRSVSVLIKRLADSCVEGGQASKTRHAEIQRGAVDQNTADAIASATGETGRRGPAKKVVVRRAQADVAPPAPAKEAEGDSAAPRA
jgi:small subunit ribosomal protein S2